MDGIHEGNGAVNIQMFILEEFVDDKFAVHLDYLLWLVG